MSAVWPDDSLGPALGDLFDEALQPRSRRFALYVPAEVEARGPEAVAEWVQAEHPGQAVAVVPQKQQLDAWRRRVDDAQHLSPAERARFQQAWLTARGDPLPQR